MRASRFLTLPWLMFAAVAMGIYVQSGLPMGDTMPDTDSYYNSWDILVSGQIDVRRTPVYPIVLGACRAIFGQYSAAVVVALQWIAFLCALACLWRLLCSMKINRGLSFMVILGGISVFSVSKYNAYLLTESFNLSGMIFWMSLMYECVAGRRRMRDFIWLSTTTLVLIFLRPGNLFLLVVNVLAAGFFMLKNKDRRKWGTVGIGMMMTGVLLTVYAFGVKSKIGVFTVTEVSINNNYTCDRASGVIDPALVEDAALRDSLAMEIHKNGERIGENIQNWTVYNSLLTERWMILGKIGYQGFEKLIADSRREHPDKYAKGLAVRAVCMMSYRLGIFGAMGYVYLITAIMAVVGILNYRRELRMSVFTLLMAATVAAGLAVCVLSGPNDWGRLCLPVYPMALLLACMLVQRVLRAGSEVEA